MNKISEDAFRIRLRNVDEGYERFESSPVKDPVFIEEWVSCGNIGFANVSLYDSEGAEIQVPKCPKCDVSMSCVIGKESYKWLCSMRCDNGQK